MYYPISMNYSDREKFDIISSNCYIADLINTISIAGVMNPSCIRCGSSTMPTEFLRWQCVSLNCKHVVTDEELERIASTKEIAYPIIQNKKIRKGVL